MERIKKITVGPDIKDGMHYRVDQEISNKENKIVDIKRTEPRTYQIWVRSTDGTQEVKLWREFEYMPVSIEYNLDYE